MEWISVEDQLPDEVTEVLAWYKSNRSNGFAEVVSFIWGEFTPIARAYDDRAKVTHWQYLPGPPK